MLIKDTTLVIIDCIDEKRSLKAITNSLLQCEFERVVFLTSLETTSPYKIEIPQIKSIQEYSIFCIKELHKYINTKFMLIIQHDGWVVDVTKWNDEFYNYDYIGGNCRWMDKEEKGGVGGFSFRSLELMKKASEIIPVEHCHPEDASISSTFKNKRSRRDRITGYRKGLEGLGFKFATANTQKLFSFNGRIYNNNTFGHHKARRVIQKNIKKE